MAAVPRPATAPAPPARPPAGTTGRASGGSRLPHVVLLAFAAFFLLPLLAMVAFSLAGSTRPGRTPLGA